MQPCPMLPHTPCQPRTRSTSGAATRKCRLQVCRMNRQMPKPAMLLPPPPAQLGQEPGPSDGQVALPPPPPGAGAGACREKRKSAVRTRAEETRGSRRDRYLRARPGERAGR